MLESKRSEGTFVCDGFRESMIDPMVYGIILNQDSFEDLMELRQMTETGIMRLVMRKYDDEDSQALEALLVRMQEVVESGVDVVDKFFQVDNEFHDKISQIGRNPLADKISRVVRTLTYSMRYETVSTMLNSGRGEELVAAHKRLYETLKSRDQSNLAEIVKESYFGETLQSGQEL